MNNAYLIGHITVKDGGKWQQYREQLPATLEPWNGELVFRGKLSAVFSGSQRHQDTVVIRFPDIQALNGWHASAQYQSLIPLRQEAADVDLLSYQT